LPVGGESPVTRTDYRALFLPLLCFSAILNLKGRYAS
jgi:hypothetical protein